MEEEEAQKNNCTESINHKEERAKEWEGLSSEHDK